jgi:hypothetical protein
VQIRERPLVGRLAAGFVRSDAAAVLVLAALNGWIASKLFLAELTPNFSSIGGAFVAIARYISRHWGSYSWWPLWHCGMPYQDTYVPLLHVVVAGFATVTRFPAGRAYNCVTGAVYCLGAVTLFLMARKLGARRGPAFLAAFTYSLFSPSAVMFPKIAADLGSAWYCRRFQVMTHYGEGPHVAAMTLLPIAILALQSAVERRTRRTFALASIAIALVFLTNVPGTMALGLAAFCWIAVQPRGSRLAASGIAAAASALAYGLACYGIPFSSLGTVMGNVGRMHGGFVASLKHGPAWLLLALAATAGAGELLRRTRLPLYVRFALLYFGLLAILVATSRPEVFELLPQVSRLHLEMEMGACLVIGAAAWWIYGRAPRRARPVLAVAALAFFTLQFQHYHFKMRELARPTARANRSEYTTAHWLDVHMPGERTYVTGSDSFWFNAFTDNPQMGGCCDQSQSMPVLIPVTYLVNVGVNPDEMTLAKAYLQALGVQALVVGGPQSTDEYKDIRDPARFDAMYTALDRENGDVIYRVPQRSDSLAHVVRAGDLVPARGSGQPERPDVMRYAAAIEDPSRPAADFRWLDGNTARIRASLERGDLVSVQVAWFPGWKATVMGQARAVSADGLGFIAIRPDCAGPCEITLEWDGRPDLPVAACVSGCSLGLAAVLLFRNRLGARRVPEKVGASKQHGA